MLSAEFSIENKKSYFILKLEELEVALSCLKICHNSGKIILEFIEN